MSQNLQQLKLSDIFHFRTYLITLKPFPLEVKNYLPVQMTNVHFLHIAFYIHSLANIISTGIAILEKANSFFPKSFNDAPMWYTTLSIIRKRS